MPNPQSESRCFHINGKMFNGRIYCPDCKFNLTPPPRDIIVCPIHGNKEHNVKSTHFCAHKIGKGCECVCRCISPQEGWVERFTKQFFVYKLGDKHPDHVGAEKEAVEFIRTTIASELELYKKGLVEKVEDKKKRYGVVYDGFSLDADFSIYNKAIDDLIAIIKNN